MEEFGKDYEIRLKANAKVNLSLDIKGVKEGYHIIDSIAAEIDIFDTVHLRKRQDKEVCVNYKGGTKFENDTALKAAYFLMNKFKTNGIDIYIEKGIPIGCGLGGSSADAAAVARGMSKLYRFPIEAKTLFNIGADVPFMFMGGAARVQGFGEEIKRISLPKLYGIWAYYKNSQVSTKESYKLYDEIGGEHTDIDLFLKNLENPVNSLEKASIILLAQIAKCKELLIKTGLNNVVMTGSGSGVIAYSTNQMDIIRALNKLKDTKNDEIQIHTFKHRAAELKPSGSDSSMLNGSLA